MLFVVVDSEGLVCLSHLIEFNKNNNEQFGKSQERASLLILRRRVRPLEIAKLLSTPQFTSQNRDQDQLRNEESGQKNHDSAIV
jgi:hypothetical protein